MIADQFNPTTSSSICLPSSLFDTLSEQGLDGLGEAVKVLINEAMKLERSRHLQAQAYERTPERQGYANGFKNKSIKSRLGQLDLEVPQTRAGDFYPSSLERGLRSERALKLAIGEMYVQGVSTRKVAKITQALCGFEVSSTQVSQAAKQMDEELTKWRERPLSACPYVFLDARYEKVRHNGVVIDCAVLWACGVNQAGKRHLLGVSVALSEAEVHWRSFLEQLMSRGLHGIQLITSDAHSGLRAALKAVLPGVAWQRCQFHLQQNAQAYVPNVSLKTKVSEDIRHIFNTANRDEALRLLQQTALKYQKKAPRLAAWLEDNIPEGLSVFNFPVTHQKRLRTSNLLERLSREIKRRTNVVKIFPNEASCLRLVTALLMETSDEWETGNVYLRFNE